MASLVRILLLTLLLAVVAAAILWRGVLTREQVLRDQLIVAEERLASEIATRDAVIERLGRTRRLARLEVGEQTRDPDGTITGTAVEFIELDDSGREVGRRAYEVPGSVVFVDTWTVRFDAERVGRGDPMRGRTLVLFRRLYSDRMAPVDGFPIDTPGGVPDGYAATEAVRWERAIWSRFWAIASDPEEARKAGIRVAQGEAVYRPVRTGDRFDLVAEALGGVTLVPAAD